MHRGHLAARALLWIASACGEAFAADEIHFTFTGQTSVTFDWRGADSTIRYGSTTAYGSTVTAYTPSPLPFSSPGPFWEARLTGLQENTLYHYSIGGGPDHTFRTPIPRGASGFAVYAEGDIGNATNWPRMGVIQSMIAAGQPDFVLALGDLTYANPGGQELVGRHFNDVMVWSQEVAYMPVWGNHEHSSPSNDDLRNYKGRFDFPNPQTSPGSPAVSCCGEDWYWFDYGNVRFIGYPESWSGAWSDWGNRAAPLMAEAQSDPAIRFIVTFGHKPAYSSGYHDGSSALKTLLDGFGTTYSKYVLNLNGHSHNYERSYPQFGVVHITSGTGGNNLETSSPPCVWPGGCPAPAWSAYRAMHHVALRLDFTAAGIQGTVYCGPPGDTGSNLNDISCAQGEVIDSFIVGDAPPVVLAPASVGVPVGNLLTVSVTASDPDGQAIGSLTASGLPAGATFSAAPGNTNGTLSWTPAPGQAGLHVVTFTATNVLSGSASTSIAVGNQPPLVNAGPDQTVTLPSLASLNGTASDDGLPNPPGSLTTAWSVSSGPGPVTFESPGALATQASFTAAGTYLLRLTAGDGALSAADTVEVVVLPAPPPGAATLERRIATGTDDAEENPSGGVSLSSSDIELVYDGSNQTVGMRFAGITIPAGASIDAAYIQFETDEVQTEATSLVIQAQAADNAATFAGTVANVSSRPRTAASVSWAPPAWMLVGEVGLGQRTPDLKSVVQQVVNRPGWVSGNAMVIVVTGTGRRTARAYEGNLAGAPLLHIGYSAGIPPPPPPNAAPLVDAGPDQTISLPANAALSGTAGDDGLPNPPGLLTTTWSVASGPGPVSFQDPNAPVTQAGFTAPGTYRLRLTASDGVLTASDSVQITVRRVGTINTRPTANAGPDQVVMLPAGAVLSGTASDDGLPNPPGVLTTTWSVSSGPGPVTFQNPGALATQAGFTAPGTYLLRLTVSDGAMTAADSVQVTVLAAPPPPAVTVERRIAAGSDDAEENTSNRVSINNNGLELVYDKSDQTVGLRFAGLAIPRGATVTRAWIQFAAKEVQSEVTSLVIQAEAADNAVTFDNTIGNVSSRPRSAAAADWSPPAWALVGEAGAGQRTPDLSAVIQEVVSRPGWGSANALAIIVTGTGHRTAWSYEGRPTSSPLLHVEYTMAAPPGAQVAPTPAVVNEESSSDITLSVIGPDRSGGPLRVEFHLPSDEAATLEVLDVTGRRHLAREVGSLGAGHHQMAFRDVLPAGIYLVRLAQGSRVQVRKAIVLR